MPLMKAFAPQDALATSSECCAGLSGGSGRPSLACWNKPFKCKAQFKDAVPSCASELWTAQPYRHAHAVSSVLRRVRTRHHSAAIFPPRVARVPKAELLAVARTDGLGLVYVLR
jgi:hypothetical protein